MANAMTNWSRVNTLLNMREEAAKHGIRVGVRDTIKGHTFGLQRTNGTWLNLCTEEFLGQAIGNPDFSVASRNTLPITQAVIDALREARDA
jgi:hypothetical protein